MRVLIITEHDVSTGCPTAVVEVPEGACQNEIFVEWVKDFFSDMVEGWTDDEILEDAPCSWCVKEVTSPK